MLYTGNCSHTTYIWHEYAKYMWIMKTILHYVYYEEIIVECLHSTGIFAIM